MRRLPCALLLAATSSFALPAGAQRPDAPRDVAVLVAVWHTAPGERAARNDVRLLRKALERYAGLPAERCVLVEGRDATVSGILETLRRAATRLEPGGELLFYLSTDGARVAGTNTRTWLAADSREQDRQGTHDFSAAALYAVLGDLASERHASATLLTDAGHVLAQPPPSGRRTRCRAAPPARRAPRPDTWQAWPAHLRPDPRGEHVIHLTATLGPDPAFDTKPLYETDPDRRDLVCGAFTWALVQALKNLRPDSTWRDVARDCQTYLRVAPDQPVVWIGARGPLDRLVRGGRVPARPRAHAGLGHGESQAKIDAGELQDLQRNDEVAVLDATGRELGLLEVGFANEASARGFWLSRSAAGEGQETAGQPLWFAPRRRPQANPLLRVFATDPDLAVQIKSDAFALVRAARPEENDYVLERLAGSDYIVLRTPEDVVLWAGRAAKFEDLEVASLDRALAREGRHRSLWRLVSPGARPTPRHDDLRLTVSGPRDGRVSRPRDPSGGFQAAGEDLVVQGPLAGSLSFEVRNTSGRALHVLVLALDELRHVWRLPPGPARLAPGAAYRWEAPAVSGGDFAPDRPLCLRVLAIGTPESLDVSPDGGSLRGRAPGRLAAIFATSGQPPGMVDVAGDWSLAWRDLLLR